MKTQVTIPAFPRFSNVDSTKSGKNKKKTVFTFVFAFTCINVILRVFSYKVYKKGVLHHTPRVITLYRAFDLYACMHVQFVAPSLGDRLQRRIQNSVKYPRWSFCESCF